MQHSVAWEDASLPLLLSTVRSRMQQVSWRLLQDHGITPQQFQVLARVEAHPDLSHGDLAATLGLDKPTATRLIQAVQAKGWLEVLPHPNHGRKLRLRLTAAGELLMKELGPFRRTMRAGLEVGFSPDELRTFRQFMKRLAVNLDALESGEPGSHDSI